ncbi:MAG TPA: TetR/AcrR family transcriptional regulator [Acidimicrobiales bacterium]|jgi:TetR/AcrR family tetracycline transcriptional repressor|nr:TetR/AcrR family transcriptional regulator [Acidimicrobiales bacterium]
MKSTSRELAGDDGNDLNLDRVVSAALQMIERVGVDQMTMRMLADHLGCSPMATYRYVKSKDALLELAADAVLSSVKIPQQSEGSWDERLAMVSRSVWDEMWGHSWIPGFVIRRSQTTRAQSSQQRRIAQAVQEILEEAGFGAAEGRTAFGFYWAFTTGMLLSGGIGGVSLGSDPTRNRRVKETFKFGLDAMIAGLKSQLP